MAKPDYDEKQTWSTWEELLLACAVHRYGIDSWDSVAAEIQKRNSTFRTLTAFDCRHKYNDLKRRFSRRLVSTGSGEGETVAEISSVPWLEELRKLRVDELRREVERYDLSISSLQLKVKRLEDEREKSLKETVTETENSDLGKIAEEPKESHRESGENAVVSVAEPPNSPDPKENSHGTESENTNRDLEIAQPVDEEPNQIGGEDSEEKPVREDSGRGSCESVAKESAANSDRVDPEGETNDSPEFVESMDESKEEEEAKETSDVQSSASLPRKETAEQDKPDNEDQSLTVDKTRVESQPLINFVEMLQTHPIGSHFSRRLESQLQEETPEYDKLIRQHIDFEMIRTRVEEGYYKSCKSKFFRDLLLLINNARVFHGERSSEFNAAKELNQLIKKQMRTLKVLKQTSPPKEEPVVTPKEEITVSSLKPTMSVPIIACRKRSSLAVRSSASVIETFKKKSKIVPKVNEKPVSEEEEDKSSDDEPINSKKMAKGRTPSAAKKVGSQNVKTSLNAGLPSKVRSSNDCSEPKKTDQEKKGNNNASGGSKKQSAASFLKRMKGVSSSDTSVDTAKADSSNGKKGGEERKSNSKNEKVDSGKPPASHKRSTGKKPTIEKASSPTKKNTGGSSKREASEKEADSSRPKKRSRR